MKLIEALELLDLPDSEDALPFRVFLACGFTPLHLQTFLAAHLRTLFPRRRIEIATGLFGDLAVTLESFKSSDFDVLAITIEWQDLEPRLGIRRVGGWRCTDLADIMTTASRQIARLERTIKQISRSTATSICLPTLPLPPLFFTRPQQGSAYEFELREDIEKFASSICSEPGIRIVNSQRLSELSPLAHRFDMKSEVIAGFPYTRTHAAIVAELLATLIHNPTPKKGLITDLDDTLWAGILGEVGVHGISWDLDHHSHLHGLYQQFLTSLASAGTLVGIASKSDPTLVEEAFARKDLLLSKESVFPLEIHWNRKSESVQRILGTWNIGPEAVVFVDDSPMEVAEVNAAFPEMQCILFPKNDHQAFWDLIRRLRELFGKTIISEEDSFRLQSIRNASVLQGFSEGAGTSLDEFLRNAEASISFCFGKQRGDARALDLINKTNQFNLNGRRFNESEWRLYLEDPETFLITVTYEDKFGPLGKIAVIMGKVQVKNIVVASWVMSCRAFSRRIEHQSLQYLFERFGVDEIILDYKAIPRNGPLREFFAQFLSTQPLQRFTISRAAFLEKAPSLFHHVKEVFND